MAELAGKIRMRKYVWHGICNKYDEYRSYVKVLLRCHGRYCIDLVLNGKTYMISSVSNLPMYLTG